MRKPPVSERFLQAFDDPAIFDCGEINLLKVVQDALIREVGNKQTRWPKTWFDQPRWMLHGMFFAKRLLKGTAHFEPAPELKKRSLMAIVPPRFVPNEQGQSDLQYLGRIFNHIPREKMVLMYVSPVRPMPVKPDITKEQADATLNNHTPDSWEWQFIEDLANCYHRICSEGRFTKEEQAHIHVGMDEFWQNFRAMDRYLSMLNLRKALLIPGYYMEFLVAALKKHNVEVIELQHGVITEASHFYCYPEKIKSVQKRALFPDRIWLFGESWKQQLQKGVGFEASQMEVFGDYFVRYAAPPSKPERLDRFVKKFSERLLVGTQTKRHEQFNRMVRNLATRYGDAKPQVGIVVKPHPAEDPELYRGLEEFPNVLITDASLDYLYPRCTAYVSMYSNTLFEAARHQHLKIFVLHSPETAEFTEGIVASGVALRMNEDDNPLELSEPTPLISRPQPDHFFREELNVRLLKDL